MADAPGNPSSGDDVIRRRARAVSRVLGIDPGSYAGREPEAFVVMSHLVVIPLVLSEPQRRTLVNEVLALSNRLLPADQPANALFNRRVREVASTMQVHPGAYSPQGSSNEGLLTTHTVLKWALVIVAPFVGAAPSALDALSGARDAGREGRGRLGGAMDGAYGAFSGNMRGRLGVAAAVGAGVWALVNSHQSEVEAEIARRYQNGQITAAEYEGAMGDDLPLPEQFLTPLR